MENPAPKKDLEAMDMDMDNMMDVDEKIERILP